MDGVPRGRGEVDVKAWRGFVVWDSSQEEITRAFVRCFDWLNDAIAYAEPRGLLVLDHRFERVVDFVRLE